ncbi:hypothetical protein RV15_GL001646 [Enterococcus silesiacus]|uniref:Uncharacterized protein n=1 Tax=Enterococcus silesiacus TaxID=332949 RepID=A0AA91JN97_9ENTE|nr:hypothetical protein RV15_GL001646 [Enterococcus silesiacus]
MLLFFAADSYFERGAKPMFSFVPRSIIRYFNRTQLKSAVRYPKL